MSSKQAQPAPKIVALPSVSGALYSLPTAQHLGQVNIHPSSSAQRAKESEAKLKKVLAANTAQGPARTAPSSTASSAQSHAASAAGHQPDSPVLMMRTGRR